ncbi:MAG: hypothetical protein BZ138_07435 [Methanosphaera sp. rholeuAM270]|nr:MAG: hypothetical protein BZ138_07435 [Methanosphaera sp. rholeuAM270]
MKTEEEINKITTENIGNIAEAVYNAWEELKQYYDTNKNDIGDYYSEEISQIIYDLEKSENYNAAFEKMDELRIFTRDEIQKATENNA